MSSQGPKRGHIYQSPLGWQINLVLSSDGETVSTLLLIMDCDLMKDLSSLEGTVTLKQEMFTTRGWKLLTSG